VPKYYGLIDRIAMKRITSALHSKKMRQLEADYPISIEQQRLLTFGAVLFTMNLESCRTFQMKTDRQAAIKLLDEWWGITGREEAVHVAEYLSAAEGHTSAADPIYQNLILNKALHLVSQKEALEHLVGLRDYQIEELGLWNVPVPRIIAGLDSYQVAREVLMDLGYTEAELSWIRSTAAWDYGRTGLIARHSVKAGYLEEDEAWEIMRAAAHNATRIYRSWRAFLAGYVIGRAVGYGNNSTDIYAPLRYLLHNENSPFRQALFY